MILDDMELVRAYAESRSEEAFATLVSRYVNLVYSAALRKVGAPDMAGEITQAVFILLARKAAQLGPGTILPSWLHRTACFAAADAVKSQRRRSQREQEAYMQSLQSEPSANDDYWRQIAPVLDGAISKLGQSDRDAIVLRFFGNKSLREVGAAMGASEDAAKVRVNRALEKLRKIFLKEGVSSTTAIIAGSISVYSIQVAPAALEKSVTAAALAHGAAAGSSTLSVLKGTLKIMAWTKVKTAVVIGAIALVAASAVTTTFVIIRHEPVFTPPAHPNPMKILYDGLHDAGTSNCGMALAKYVWYRDNALKFDPAQTGVRDSFALMYWAQLAQKYPPAMKPLKRIYADGEKQIHEGKSKAAASGFIICSTINLNLGEKPKTIELFKWLDQHNHAAAAQVFNLVQFDLARAGEYALCDRYLNSEQTYAGILQMYNMTRNRGKKQGTPQQVLDFAGKNFSYQVAMLVAVLELTHHPDEAEHIAGEAAKEYNTPEFTALLADAKAGNVPAEWPPHAQ